MAANRNIGLLVPIVKHVEDIEDVQEALETVDVNRETNRVVGLNQKGKFEVPRTDCWNRFIDKPNKHSLNCGHVITLDASISCGINCRLSKNAKNTPHGTLINCQACIDRKRRAASLFLPKKKSRRHSNPEGRMAKIEVDASDLLFADSSAVLDNFDDDLDLARKQLATVGYGRKRRSSIIELSLPPSPNPRKRRAVEEPNFLVHDCPTGEKPKRRPSVYVPDEDELDAIRKYPVIHDKPACICGSSTGQNLLMCVWCDRYFHPTCAGTRELDHYQYSTYGTGEKQFCCVECKGGLEEAEVRKAAEKKAVKVERAMKRATPAGVMAEMGYEYQNQREAKERRKKTAQKDILRSKTRAKAIGKAKKKGVEEGTEVDEPTTQKPILKSRKSDLSPPASVHFALKENRGSKKKSLEFGKAGDMDVDDD